METRSLLWQAQAVRSAHKRTKNVSSLFLPADGSYAEIFLRKRCARELRDPKRLELVKMSVGAWRNNPVNAKIQNRGTARPDQLYRCV
jgi:hypothetical protein